MWTRRVLGMAGSLCLLAGLATCPAFATDSELSLTEAVLQALDGNLDLVARRRALDADREEIDLALAALLPQIDVGARAQIIESERSDDKRGVNTKESVLLGAGLQQVLYDENSWARYQIQKQVYAAQVQDLESFRLGVVRDAADAFLALDQAKVVLEIQQRNREVTRRNLETSRARIVAGWSSDREVLRWESQLAGNDGAVRVGHVAVLQSQFELNRVRNRPPEGAIAPQSVSVGEYGFVYSRDSIAKAIAAPDEDRRMRDFLVRLGLGRSPDLLALDADIAAQERQLTASKRAFWVPSLSVGAGVDYLAAGGSGRSADFNQTEWGARGLLTFPLLQGGAKFAGLRQSRDSLASLRVQKGATAQSVEQATRAAMAQASGAYANISFAQREFAAARRNFELVDASYILGVASILDVLDAQNQLLSAELAVAQALYGFLQDLVAAELQLAYFPFLEPVGEVEELLDALERALGVTP